MMALKFFHLTVQWKGAIEVELLESAFQEPVHDWYRMNAYSWYLAFEQSPQELSNLIKSALGNRNFVLVKLDLKERYGWAPNPMWKWIDKYRSFAQ